MRNTIVSLWVVLLAGCLPAPYGPYLRPSHPAPSSVHEREFCSGHAGPPTRLRFDAPGEVRFEVSAPSGRSQREESGRPFDVWVSVPPQARFRFLDPAVRIATSASDVGRPTLVEPRVVASVSVGTSEWIEFSRLGPTPAEAAERAVTRDPEVWIASALLADPGPDVEVPPGTSFELRFPAIETASGRIELASQRFQRDGDGNLRTSDRMQALAERHARCLRETPRARCQNILEFDPESFEVPVGDFLFVGRFGHPGGLLERPLRYELRVKTRTTETWRLAAPNALLTDLATGQRFELPISVLHVTFAYPISLATPVTSNATLVFRTRLEDSPSRRWRVHLPDYEIGGVRHAIEPVELEMRYLDGGIEPFNC